MPLDCTKPPEGWDEQSAEEDEGGQYEDDDEHPFDPTCDCESCYYAQATEDAGQYKIEEPEDNDEIEDRLYVLKWIEEHGEN